MCECSGSWAGTSVQQRPLALLEMHHTTLLLAYQSHDAAACESDMAPAGPSVATARRRHRRRPAGRRVALESGLCAAPARPIPDCCALYVYSLPGGCLLRATAGVSAAAPRCSGSARKTGTWQLRHNLGACSAPRHGQERHRARRTPAEPRPQHSRPQASFVGPGVATIGQGRLHAAEGPKWVAPPAAAASPPHLLPLAHSSTACAA